MKKRMVCLVLALMMVGLSLTACGAKESGNGQKEESPVSSQSVGAEQKTEGKVVHGIINKIDSFLVLLTDDGEYQIMDYGDGVTMDGFAEGDKVNVTYTGELGVEGSTPVATAITKAE